MTVTASKPISMSDIRAEFGGTGPLTDYYKDGGIVPSIRPGSSVTTLGSLSAEKYAISGPYAPGDGAYYIKQEISTGNYKEVEWHGAWSSSGGSLSIPSVDVGGGYQYVVGTPSTTNNGGFYYHPIQRQTLTVTTSSDTPINADVPTGGDISLTDFYSATAT
jgi:hypothetical protein